MARIQLICCLGHIKAGLHAEVLLLTELLTAAGHTITFTRGVPAGPGILTPPKQPAEQCYDLNIFLEHCGPQRFLDQYLAEARYNALLPNPEGYWPDWAASLPSVDVVFCKTYDAEHLFRRLCGSKALYTSFTSADNLRSEIPRGFDLFHGPGFSIWRGTSSVMALWEERGATLPKLQLYFSPMLIAEQVIDLYQVPNVVKHLGSWEREAFAQIQNQYHFHLCPSIYEGFGQHIHEAKSIGAIPVTTDASPLTEFVRPEFGILIPPARQVPLHFIQLQQVDPVALHVAIQHRVIPLMGNECRMAEMSALARADWERNDRFFRQRFPEVIDNLIGGQASSQ